MMHRCSSGCHGNMVGHCSCGAVASSAAFSMFLSMPNNNHTQCYKTAAAFHNEDENVYSFAAASNASVDCTLSLATPSTRRFNENEKRGERRMSNFCWDILQPSKQSPPSAHKSASASAADGIVPRRCANCDTTSTPLWRNGPRGPKSLCNACGIRFKKEERRASAAAATATATCAAAGGVGIETQHMINTSWVHHHHTQAQKMGYYSSAYGNEFRFIDDDHRDSDTGAIPFISWRLGNVADRSSLVHDFTR